MSMRYVCDNCGSDIVGKPWGKRRPVIHWGGDDVISAYVTTSNRNTWNGGDYCGSCIAARLESLAAQLRDGTAREQTA